MTQTKFGSFSDAILFGAQLRPQGFGCLFPGELSCAIGAGVEAVYGEADPRFSSKDLAGLFPYLDNRVHACPEAECQMLSVVSVTITTAQMIAHLNDCHHWTRESIAQWLRDEVEDKAGYVTLTESVKQPVLETDQFAAAGLLA